MNILLFNSNPVVNKLVTLSAQKTSNTVDIAQNIDDIDSKKYDILIIDDELYSPEIMEEISNRIEYKKSLYVCSKDAKAVEEFTKTLKKPFLPTDLVELMISLSKETKETDTPQFELLDDTDTSKDDNDFDEMQDLESFDFDDLESLDEEALDSKTSDSDEHNDLDEELDFDELDDDLMFDDTDVDSSSKTSDGILDKEELQEVQNLLDETESQEEDDSIFEDFDLENDLELDKDDKKLEDGESSIHGDDFPNELPEDLTDEDSEDFSFEEDVQEGEDLFDEDELKEEELSFDETKMDEDEFLLDEEIEEEKASIDENKAKSEELSFDEIEKEDPVDELFSDEKFDFSEDSFDSDGDDLKALESKIESAVKELSDEDLESEVDEDMLLDIDSLTSRDLKLAIGEEVDEEESTELDNEDEPVYKESQKEDVEQVQKSVIHEQAIDDTSNDGVEALKKLLKALSNEDVAASLKGMKININITLGESQ